MEAGDRRSSDGETRPLEPRDDEGRHGFTLLISHADGVAAVPLQRDVRAVVLGRTRDADVIVADESVSRRHAVLRPREMTIEDLDSMNGTRVNGARLRPHAPEPIALGTLIELGSATIVVQRARIPRAVPRPAPPRDERPPVVGSATMKRLFALLDIVAPSPLNVLILGETGVGKERFAEAIHARSRRAEATLLRLNCAALPESVLEGELFGYERGAFTGATQGRPGLFESADGGTVFLDEVGDLPLSVQAKLLRVLENGEVLRIGGRKPSRVDVRFVSATNRDLRFLMGSGQFRSDLYFRLNGMAITIPPLRERAGDIQPLAEAFLVDFAARVSRPAPSLAPEALFALSTYAWPGNVRELRNVLDRSAVMCAGGALTLDVLRDAAPEVVAGDAEPPRARQPAPAPAAEPPRAPAGQAERERILDALAQANGNQKRAAEILGVSRRTLGNKLDALAIGRPRKSGR